MKISFIKFKGDKNYKIPETLGMNVFEIKKQEDIDNKIEELKNENYNTFFITSELASFSDKIMEYKKSKDINLIITPNKK